ncbi:MAG: alpha/beta hydrolase [Candidatus Omnitrophica bacterium]|nr:alpha/beta hydrolase [Candidatus Omnitrophota bacterium]MCM8802590.1 alpha/beta hydrolase [Candidatus Omnitrophota bacterium]
MEKKIEIIKDIPYRKVKNKELFLDIIKRVDEENKKLPVIVYIHGGGWISGNKETGLNKLLPFVENGYLGVSISYRLSNEAKFPAQIEDCKCAIRFLRANSEKYNIDSEKIGVWGESAGGNLVCLLGVTDDNTFNNSGEWKGYSSRVSAVCDWFGRTNFLIDIKRSEEGPYVYISKLLGGPIEENLEKAIKVSPYYYETKNCPPFLIVHGENDNIVPYSQSEMFYNKLKKNKVDVTLIKVKNAGHGVGFSKKVVNYVISFFDYHLKGQKDNWKEMRKNKRFLEIQP